MGEVKMIECDNPDCDNVSVPEFIPKGKTPPTAPFGWWQLDAWRVGPGPYLKAAYACSNECIGPAVLHRAKEAVDGL